MDAVSAASAAIVGSPSAVALLLLLFVPAVASPLVPTAEAVATAI
jgi:hypothetical protein